MSIDSGSNCAATNQPRGCIWLFRQRESESADHIKRGPRFRIAFYSVFQHRIEINRKANRG